MATTVRFEDVLDDVRAGEPAACERLFNSMARRVAGFLRAQGVADPEGLTNEVFHRVFSSIDRFDGGEGQFRAWVFTIARNLVADERRRAARRPWTRRALDKVVAIGGDVEEEALDQLGNTWAREILQALSSDQRDVLLLRVVSDLSVKETATVLGKTPGAVKTLQRRALASLRRHLRTRGEHR